MAAHPNKSAMSNQLECPPSYQALLDEARPVKLVRYDPLLQLLFRFFPTASYPVLIVPLVLYPILILAAGFVLSLQYRQAGMSIVGAEDPRTLYFDLFAYLVFIPLVWLFYVWQLRGLERALSQLCRNGVMGGPTAAHPALAQSSADRLFNRRWYPILALGVTVFAAAVWIQGSYSVQNPFLFGQPTKWFMVNPLYFWGIWVPLIYVNVYMLMWIIIRQAAGVLFINRAVRSFEINPRLFHPDGANGLASLGALAIRSALLIVLLGCWIVLAAIYPVFFGQSVNLQMDVLMEFALYAAAIPLFLIPPVWQAHTVLTGLKQRVIGVIGEQIQQLIVQVDPERMTVDNERLHELERRYAVIDREFHTWPFRPLAIRGFALTVALPFATTLLPFFLDKLFGS